MTLEELGSKSNPLRSAPTFLQAEVARARLSHRRAHCYSSPLAHSLSIPLNRAHHFLCTSDPSVYSVFELSRYFCVLIIVQWSPLVSALYNCVRYPTTVFTLAHRPAGKIYIPVFRVQNKFHCHDCNDISFHMAGILFPLRHLSLPHTLSSCHAFSLHPFSLPHALPRCFQHPPKTIAAGAPLRVHHNPISMRHETLLADLNRHSLCEHVSAQISV